MPFAVHYIKVYDNSYKKLYVHPRDRLYLMTQAVDFTSVWGASHKAMVTNSVSDKARYLLSTIGPRITTAALGMADARPVKHWASDPDDGGPREHVVTERLDVLFRITRAVSDAYGPPVAATFWRSSNPQLDDNAPLLVLADATELDDMRPVLAAARALLEG